MEFLIRVVHRTLTPNAPKVGESMAGDVIAAQPDGWAWTVAELTNPDWRIVRAPLTAVEAEALLSIERIPDNAPRGTVGQRRKFNFDLTKLPGSIKAAIGNDKRPTPILDATPFLTGMRSAVVQKPASF